MKAVKRIATVPGILGGKPVVRGTRISVELVLNLLSRGMNAEEVLEEYPSLRREDVLACLEYAARTVAGEEIVAVSRAR
jgi:uncharacterized protein (DUF433 family)